MCRACLLVLGIQQGIIHNSASSLFSWSSPSWKAGSCLPSLPSDGKWVGGTIVVITAEHQHLFPSLLGA